MHYLKKIKVLLSLIALIAIAGCNRDEDSVLLKFLGEYTVNDSCGSANTTYTMIIREKNENNNELYLDNFGGYGPTIVATVSEQNPDIIKIDTHADNLHIVGEGTINNERDEITFTYQTSNNNISTSCSSIAKK
ncbi:hypothetical protein [Chryseobacterium shandongense]|uniref:hypothetical protein n=1 Tax=Chryseobacterium shandongense TaxID=1493872 RepID=UPI000F5004FE|nr:hypothetical protein [Chryseobacterium shandongense]AZA58333.1 hypothetical protein EG350_14550 [Chryseobacterium shandongense]